MATPAEALPLSTLSMPTPEVFSVTRFGEEEGLSIPGFDYPSLITGPMAVCGMGTMILLRAFAPMKFPMIPFHRASTSKRCNSSTATPTGKNTLHHFLPSSICRSIPFCLTLKMESPFSSKPSPSPTTKRHPTFISSSVSINNGSMAGATPVSPILISPSGDYVFNVRAKKPDSSWSRDAESLHSSSHHLGGKQRGSGFFSE